MACEGSLRTPGTQRSSYRRTMCGRATTGRGCRLANSSSTCCATVTTPPGEPAPSEASEAMDELNLRDPDGIDVFYRRWMPAGGPRAAVLVAHGLSEPSGRYGR